MDPIKLLQIKKLITGFKSRHVRFFKFLEDMRVRGIQEGTVIEIQVKTADGQEYVSNFKVLPEDIEFLTNIQNLSR